MAGEVLRNLRQPAEAARPSAVPCWDLLHVHDAWWRVRPWAQVHCAHQLHRERSSHSSACVDRKVAASIMRFTICCSRPRITPKNENESKNIIKDYKRRPPVR